MSYLPDLGMPGATVQWTGDVDLFLSQIPPWFAPPTLAVLDGGRLQVQGLFGFGVEHLDRGDSVVIPAIIVERL